MQVSGRWNYICPWPAKWNYSMNKMEIGIRWMTAGCWMLDGDEMLSNYYRVCQNMLAAPFRVASGLVAEACHLGRWTNRFEWRRSWDVIKLLCTRHKLVNNNRHVDLRLHCYKLVQNNLLLINDPYQHNEHRYWVNNGLMCSTGNFLLTDTVHSLSTQCTHLHRA